MDDWSRAALTTGLGFLAGIITQTLVPFITRFVDGKQLERSLYIEILSDYTALYGILGALRRDDCRERT
jgi:O-antigen/teichoic acid export membrane protein